MLCSASLVRHFCPSSRTACSLLSFREIVSPTAVGVSQTLHQAKYFQLSALHPDISSSQSPDTSSTPSSPPKQPRSALNMVKGFYSHYGYTALVFHTGVSAVSLVFWVSLVRSPVDLAGFMAQIGVLTPLQLVITNTATSFGAGSFAFGYVLHKLTGPIRLLITILTTPVLMRKYGGREAKAVTREKPSST